jgi:acyl-CoA synthetase (AMP-forming)/AMP-acid ligase II
MPITAPGCARALERLHGVARAHPGAVIGITPETAAILRRADAGAAELARGALLLDDGFGAASPIAPLPDLAPEAPACVQFTSGSTGTPRGTVLTHANLLANLALIRRVFRLDTGTVALGWLPLHHDMGFVGHVLQPLFAGGTGVLGAPGWFARDPLGWLRAIGRFGVESSGAPPFAYHLCLRRLRRGDATAEIDLSCWRTAYIGAEPVPPGLLDDIAADLPGSAYAARRCWRATDWPRRRSMSPAPGGGPVLPAPRRPMRWHPNLRCASPIR